MANFATRLKQLRTEKSITMDKLVEELSKKFPDSKISKGMISRWENGGHANQKNQQLLAEYFNVTTDYLIGYSDFKNREDASRFWKEYDSSPKGKRALKRINRDIEFFEGLNNVNFNINREVDLYDHYPIGISAGTLLDIDATDINQVIVSDVFLDRYAHDKRICIMHANGDSMDKIIEDKATIAVLRESDINNITDGDVVVVATLQGEYTLKHFINDRANQRFILRPNSNNPIHTDIIISYEEASNMRLIGKVVVYNVIL